MSFQTEYHVFVDHIVGLEGGDLVGIVCIPRGKFFLDEVRPVVLTIGDSNAAEDDSQRGWAYLHTQA
jgi:hypothetical protein